MCISFHDARRAPLLEPQQERVALQKWQSQRDPSAAETLLRSHARMVHALARRWSRKGLDTDDLISAGMCGLLVAAERFDLAREVRFSTYARWWIQTMIFSEVAAQRATLSLPSKAFHNLLSGRMLDQDERDLVALAIEPAHPLDGTPRTGDGMSLSETLASDTPTPEDHLVSSARIEALRDLLSDAIKELSSPGREIMVMRSGADPASHAEIAKSLDLRPAQVRDLERSAHMRLRKALLSQGITPANLW